MGENNTQQPLRAVQCFNFQENIKNSQLFTSKTLPQLLLNTGRKITTPVLFSSPVSVSVIARIRDILDHLV